jgi:hypothetical protein
VILMKSKSQALSFHTFSFYISINELASFRKRDEDAD